ncbi:FAD-dependent oxidoreductase [Paenibacillus alkalitolerans]|uniref:FAD-dependent oxidoreductase n=1 Tax=Paenibacillus alkalitolerans TaxID=2799335 RepID=UPI0018F7167D|nr:FAD-dependent oxidoreductase [Paenibacillus alkalitolerans]
MGEKTADIIVLGGGLGGCMASLAAAKLGLTVVMTEETDWLGGQLTSQAVPPDEHRWIESFGCTQTYREFRNRVRQYYKDNYPMTEDALRNERLNPGNGWVSRLCHEPKVALRIIEDMLAPYVSSGRITVYYGCRVVSAETDRDYIVSVTVKHVSSGQLRSLNAFYYLDATECGDLLPLAGVEYVTGREAKSETGEAHALETADPLDIQSFTFVFAVDYVEGADFTIEKPEQYDFWRGFVPGFSRFPLFGWKTGDLNDPAKVKEITFLPDGSNPMPYWTYRRIIDRSLFANGLFESDITLINWSLNDYFLGPIYEVPEEEREKHLKGARQLSLSLLYWLQTEAPRPGGGRGYPGIRLRKDVLGTEDGLAKHPYIRESRRIKAVYTITENDVSLDVRGKQGIRRYEDSVGVGSYHLDLHTTTKSNRGFFIPSLPFEIPLGALLPVRMKNMLPACKNIGTTQITNGCYRLHPTEWNIGESAGYLAAYSVLNRVTPHQVRENKEHLGAFLELIRRQGIETHWPDGLLS